MPVIRPSEAKRESGDGPLGAYVALLFSDSGGLTQFGAFLEILEPGAHSSELHWHETEDEFVYLVSGALVLVEGDGNGLTETPMLPGDAATFKAGHPIGHCLVNRGAVPARYIVVGTRTTTDSWHYPLKDEHVTRDGAKRTVRNGRGDIIRTYEK
jgi:uncharacterized cupin superfamily protein